MKILVVDGQGGGVGSAVVAGLIPHIDPECFIACGTNSKATQAMQKAGARYVATGENAILYHAKSAQIIAGSMGILSANSMLGELSPKMAQAITESEAIKVLIPFQKCRLQVVGIKTLSLTEKVEEAVKEILNLIQSR